VTGSAPQAPIRQGRKFPKLRNFSEIVPHPTPAGKSLKD